MRTMAALHVLFLAILPAVSFGVRCCAQEPVTSTEIPSETSTELESAKQFEQFVRPVFTAHCISCHGAEKSEAGLRLDERSAFLRGGESGPLIASAAQESLLLKAIRYEGPEMPPSHPLPEAQIDAITVWVLAGASWPEYAVSIQAPASSVREFTDEERSYWLFQPHQPVSPPSSHREHPIDAFVETKLAAMGLKIGEPADPATLARRAYLDLVGMPPTWSELQTFLEDESEDRYERLIAKLLEDPRYGERWGRYWLDLVRFAETDGFKQDAFRPTAYRYRDYVVHAFNADTPYSQFVIEQLAGDEIDPNSDTMNAATGYLRHWMYEYNQRDVRGQWDNILNDLTDVTGELFLGLGFSCARCHDHKFDPILQTDYYRLQAFFAPIEPRYDVPSQQKDFQAWQDAHAVWQATAQPIIDRMNALEADIRQSTIEATIDKFPPDVRPALRKPAEARDPKERQLAVLAFLQITNDLNGIDYRKRLKDEALEEWSRLKDELDALKKSAPPAAEIALTVRDVGPLAPEVMVPGKTTLGSIEPGFLSILGMTEARGTMIETGALPPSIDGRSTGRRTRLARWITHPDNPLAWRTIVNRVWQHHFGRGIVASASDLGHLSQGPSHPELLDWLADWFVQHDGSFKKLHYLMMTSETYRQSAYPSERAAGMEADPDNRFLWRYQPRRLDAEQIRDSILLVSGDLDARMGGVSDAAESDRRSIYQRVARNTPHVMLAAFDAPDSSSPVALRNHTTTSLQALWMTNSEWPLRKAESLANRLVRENDSNIARIVDAYRTVLLRPPTESELQAVLAFLERAAAGMDGNVPPTAWIDLCHTLFSSNEFLYVE